MLGVAAAGVAARAAAAATDGSPPEGLRQQLVDFGVRDGVAERARVLIPEGEGPFRCLTLLHGLGESEDPKLGLVAWSQLYGLVAAERRLREPPVVRTLPKRRYLTDEHLARLNASLRAEPFQPLVLVCPFTPNPYRRGPRVIAQLGRLLEERLLPRVRQIAPVSASREAHGLAGCSMGGYVALELYLQRPHLFGALGGVQSAFSVAQAARYAERLAQAEVPASYWGSSSQDPYRKANQALVRALGERQRGATYEEAPGPHDQPWLREVGTLALLHAFGRRLRP